MSVCSSVKDVTPRLVADCGRGGDATRMGCTYNIPPLRRFLPSTSLSMSPLDTLWIGTPFANASNGNGFTESSTLVDFYVFYLSDFNALNQDSGLNYTEKIVALKGSMNLCITKYNSSMEFGVTNTTILDQITKPEWKNSNRIIDDFPTDIISTEAPDGSNTFMIPTSNISAFNFYLSYSTFTGRSRAGTPITSQSTSSAADAMQLRFYDTAGRTKVSDGQKILSEMLSNVSTGLTNS